MRLNITTKILIVLSSLSLIALFLFGAFSFREMDSLGKFALQSNLNLGLDAVQDSERALIAQAEQNLLKTARDQAAISNALLEKARSQIGIIAQFATSIWQNPTGRQAPRSYSVLEKPADKMAASFYFLVAGLQPGPSKEEVAFSSRIDEVFIPILNHDPNLDSVYLGTETGLFRGYPWVAEFPASYDHRQRSWYIAAACSGTTVWTAPYISAANNNLIVTVATPFFTADNELIGVVEADVTLKALSEQILNTQIGEKGYAFLIDNHGNVICRPGLQANTCDWGKKQQFQNLLTGSDANLQEIAKAMIAGKSDIRRSVSDLGGIAGGEKYIAYAPIVSTNWSLGVVKPVTEITAPATATMDKIDKAAAASSEQIDRRITHALLIMAFIFIAMILIVALASRALSKRITRPLLTLAQGAKVIGSGDLDHRIELATGDETQYLAETFNRMTADLKEYVANLAKTTAAKERIESELNIAREIQASMLPRVFPPFPDRTEFAIYATMDTAKEVGGDFYDFFLETPNRLCFTIGDVSGKGVPAALFMAIVRALLRNEAMRGLHADEILTRVNNAIAPDNENCMFASVFFAILNVKTGELEYANGGHNPPLRCEPGGVYSYLKVPTGIVIGAMEGVPFTRNTMTLQPNDTLFFYTDGVTEAMNSEQKLFSEERLAQVLNQGTDRQPKAVITGVSAAVTEFVQDEPQSDDITMLVLHYRGNSDTCGTSINK